MIAQKNATLKFFREMEENIRRKASGLAEPQIMSPRKTKSDSIHDSQHKNRTNSIDRDDSKILYENRDLLSGFEGRGRLNSFGTGPPRRIRTISTMDGGFAFILFFGSWNLLWSHMLHTDEILLTMHQSHGGKNALYSKSKVHSVAEEAKRDSPSVPYRLRTGSRDFPNEMPLPLKINSKDIVMDVSSAPSFAPC
jgi:hypothetical protein